MYFDSVEHLEVGTLDVKNDFNRLVTRQLVRWAPKDYSKTEESNYTKNLRIAAILEELPDRLGTRNDGKEIVSRWLSNTPNANQIAGRHCSAQRSAVFASADKVSLKLISNI